MSQYLNRRIFYIAYVVVTKEYRKYYKLSIGFSISSQGIQGDLTISLKSQKPAQISAIMTIGTNRYVLQDHLNNNSSYY